MIVEYGPDKVIGGFTKVYSVTFSEDTGGVNFITVDQKYREKRSTV